VAALGSLSVLLHREEGEKREEIATYPCILSGRRGRREKTGERKQPVRWPSVGEKGKGGEVVAFPSYMGIRGR